MQVVPTHKPQRFYAELIPNVNEMTCDCYNFNAKRAASKKFTHNNDVNYVGKVLVGIFIL